MSLFQSLDNYEKYIYTLTQSIDSVKQSTLVVVRRGKRTAIVRGNISFDKGFSIAVRERLSFDNDEIVIESYGYELWSHGKLYVWYDSQPHPNVKELASTSPHHKHIPPNIKSNRQPTKDMNFHKPNLPFLIQEIESLLNV